MNANDLVPDYMAAFVRDEATAESPLAIMERAADEFPAKTSGFLTASVERALVDERLLLTFVLTVPRLNNMQYRLFYIASSVRQYDYCELFVPDRDPITIRDSFEFRNALKELLASPYVLQVVTELIRLSPEAA